jgi:DNA-binding NarL/FixJ family response regulator
MIRVLITDDHQLWRMGMRVLLQREQDIDVVGEARDGQEAVELADLLVPDIVLMDIRMPRMDGLRATEEIRARQPASRVVVCAASWDEPLVRQAVQSGAYGYLPKDIQPERMVSAVRAVYNKGTWFDPRVAQWAAGDKAAT